MTEPVSLSPPSLKRTLKTFGVLLVTLSYITPASSVFVIAPGVVQQAGSGAFWGFAAAAVVSFLMALVYAELASAFPYSGGEYTIIGRVLGPGFGFVTFGLCLVTGVFGLSIISLGIATYITPLIPSALPVPTAMITIMITAFLAILRIRTNAFVTGLFLAAEIIALIAITVLGFTHIHRPFAELVFHPQQIGADGAMSATTLGMIGMAISIAIFSYNGYGQAVYLGEETHNPGPRIARAILLALIVAVVTEAIPVIAVLMGAPDLPTFLSSPAMFSDFIRSTAGDNLNNAISLGVVLAIVNSNVAVILVLARLLFSSARDRVWPHDANKALMHIHTDFHSPWVATLACGILATLACLIDPKLLFVMTGTGLVATYSMLCIACLAGRRKQTTAHRAYHMPLYPLAPLLALAAMSYVAYANFLDTDIGRPSLFATAGIIGVSAGYYALILRRRGEWALHSPD